MRQAIATSTSVESLADHRAARERQKPSAIDDATLVERARGGDRWAIEALLARHLEEVGRIVTHLVGRHEEVDDVVQETLLAAVTGLDGLREPAAFRGWLLRIAINKSRRLIRRRRFLRAVGLHEGSDSVLEELVYEGVRPEVRAELAVLDKVLARMPAELRIAWTLRYVEGHTIRDVSRLSQSSLATTKRRIARAKRRIEKLVDEEVLFHGR